MWAEEAEQKWPLAYQAVMRQIMRFVSVKRISNGVVNDGA